MQGLPKFLPGQVIASRSRAGVVISAFKRRFDDGEQQAFEGWGYNIKSVDRRVILERDIVAVIDEETREWKEISGNE